MKQHKIYTLLAYPEGGEVFKAILKNGNGEMQSMDKAFHKGVRHNLQSSTFISDWFSGW
jgi:hypothetical protein